MAGPGDSPPVDGGAARGAHRRGGARAARRSSSCGEDGAAGAADRPLLTFRLDPTLWRDVRAQLAVDGRTLSDVVNQGLVEYVGGSAGSPATAARRRWRGAGDHRSVEVTLPPEISDNLQRLRATGRGKLLSATLAHLYGIGWPLRSLAEALGVSRQAVQARVRQDVPVDVRASVGRLDTPPSFPRQRQPVGPGVRRRPSTVQVDLEVRELARARAEVDGLSLTQVVESVVRRYLEEATPANGAADGEPLPGELGSTG